MRNHAQDTPYVSPKVDVVELSAEQRICSASDAAMNNQVDFDIVFGDISFE